MALDIYKCVGCADCVVACQTENNVPIGYSRDWIVEKVSGHYPKLHLHFESQRCNHCDTSPCVRVCPTGASHVIEGGIVKVTPNLCIGCGACIEACPYEARFFHPDGYVSKCTFCDHRVKEGLDPACVSVCPTYCMYFGDLDDPESDVSKVLREYSDTVYSLAPESGTKPHVFYFSSKPHKK